jgi:hypothetical protein
MITCEARHSAIPIRILRHRLGLFHHLIFS